MRKKKGVNGKKERWENERKEKRRERYKKGKRMKKGAEETRRRSLEIAAFSEA